MKALYAQNQQLTQINEQQQIWLNEQNTKIIALEDQLSKSALTHERSPHEYLQLMTEYSINDRAEFDDNQDEYRNYYAADMIQSSNKGICIPKFEMSLNKKIDSKSMTMKELYL